MMQLLRNGLAATLIAAALFWIAGAGRAAAQPSQLSLSQWKHVQWTRKDGVPTIVHGLAETPDGFLWMTSRDGLFRFDGRSFELMDGGVDRARYGLARKIAVGKGGSIWLWYPKGWIAEYRGGRLHFIKAPSPEGEVGTLLQTRDGAIWLGVVQIGKPLLRYSQGRWARVTANANREMFHDALESADGALWLSYNKSLLRMPPGATRFERVRLDVSEGAQLVADIDGAVWLAGLHGGWRLTGPGGVWRGAPSRPLHWTSTDQRWLRAEFDRDGNLWTMGRDFGRIPGLRQAERSGAASLSYEEGKTPQMSSTRPASLLVDHAGMVWYGGPRSLDRFNVPDVVIEPALINSTRYGDPLLATSLGTIYIGQNDAVYRVDPGGRPVRVLSVTTDPEAMCEDAGGAVWIVLGDRVVRLQGGTQTAFPKPPAEAGTYACGSDPSGRFWLTASTSGMYWLDGTTWKAAPPPAGAGGFDPTEMWRDTGGRLWVQTGPKSLARLDGGLGEGLSLATNPDLGGVTRLLPTSRGLLVSTSNGAAFQSSGRMVPMADRQTASLRNAAGLVQTPQSDTWLFGAAGLVRFKTADLYKAFSSPDFVIPERVFTYEDGLPNQPNAQGGTAMVRGGDGRLWLATIDGIAWIDPAHLASNPKPPGVAITSLSAPGLSIKDPSTVHLKPGASNISIGFAALSLAIPERVKLLYRLEGQDGDWVDPGARRQAFYTNLGPGEYRFQVIAANEDGTWNRVGDTLSLSVPPTFLQSWPFTLLCALLILVLIWIAYTFRVRAIANRIRIRTVERVRERERIARELHDTLLQSIQLLTLRFQFAVEELPVRAKGRPALERAIDEADQVIAEGRERVRDLRPLTGAATAEQMIRNVVDRQEFAPDVEVSVTVSGTPRDLDPIVFDEMSRIAGEAVFNIWRHARASHVSIEIDYRGPFRLRFTDDGTGIDPDVSLAGGRQGHFGIAGMRERAGKLGGEFGIRPLPDRGTEVLVTIPASIAYAHGRRDPMALLKSILGRRRAVAEPPMAASAAH